MTLFEKVKKLETNDFQGRGNRRATEGEPDTVEVYEEKNYIEIEASFKGTSDSDAINWMKRYVKSEGFEVEKANTCEDDYDWITVTVYIKK